MGSENGSEGRPSIDTSLVRRLVDSQFPEFAGLRLEPVHPGGSDHVIHRLGPELSVRLPRHAGAINQAEKELHWLPQLAPRLPLDIPTPVGVGEPDFGYPWRWAISRWLNGDVATVGRFGDSHEAALQLAGFLTALQRYALPPDGNRTDLTHDPLRSRDQATRQAITKTAAEFDARSMARVWDEALEAPPWSHAPVWFHGDFHTGNLLTTNGRITAVIDFGSLGVGDPSRDLMMAYTLMSSGPRKTFRKALSLDDATWARGRGWALTAGLIAHTAYAATNPHIATQTTRQINAALAGL